jgi:predicted ribosomally synthesized peptide with nif11-like leader
MTDNQLIQFMQAISKNPSIQEKLKQASDVEAAAIAKIAKDAGFEIPVEELKVRGCWWENLPHK